MRLRQYQCGCIGFPVDESGTAVIVKVCDNDKFDDPICFSRRKIQDTLGSQVLNKEETDKYIDILSGLIADGQRFREVKTLLGIKDKHK